MKEWKKKKKKRDFTEKKKRQANYGASKKGRAEPPLTPPPLTPPPSKEKKKNENVLQPHLPLVRAALRRPTTHLMIRPRTMNKNVYQRKKKQRNEGNIK